MNSSQAPITPADIGALLAIVGIAVAIILGAILVGYIIYRVFYHNEPRPRKLKPTRNAETTLSDSPNAK